ncbi:hypothetical protein HHL19_35320 [Streptomyces sp. R302]|uniref:hypothetical protein n=1 Tax=unclassified Streptomyces TaxID=2593676 RepID=UPI00145CAB26|nr:MULTISPECIES: hypothetical protein [unclassified Streptomyces]NML55187.1 hypothetical protein [Streptomyces sp. R301]NML83783.1 hypothetical protein [Streptomyces sp. R302]
MPTSALVDEHALMCSPAFADRVRAAFARVAREVLTEAPATHGYPLRSALARSVLNPSDLTGPGYAPALATDPLISAAAADGRIDGHPDSSQAAVTDDQLLDAVRRTWNLIAGVVDQPSGT